jgi:hypothetical protein
VIVGQVQCLLFEYHDLDARTLERLGRVEQAAIKIGEINRRLLKIDSAVHGTDKEPDQTSSRRDTL